MQIEVMTKVDAGKEKRRPQIGILGGNFNPVHNAHLMLADQVGRALYLDQVWLMPEGLPPHIDYKETIPGNERLAMLKIAIANNAILSVETCELQRSGKSYTYDTMKQLIAAHPNVDFYFIIGGDMVEYLPKWYNIDALINMVQFVGVKRPGYTEYSDYPIMWIDVPLMDLSSTKIREAIRCGKSVRYMLPDDVIAYIEAKGLYQDGVSS